MADEQGNTVPQGASGWGGMRFLWRLLWTLVFNSFIAAFLTAIGYGGTFAVNMLFAQCIGLSIFAMIELVPFRRLAGGGLVLAIVIAVAVGALLGVVLALWMTGVADERARAPVILFLQTVAIALVFGGIAGYYFFSRERLLRTRTSLQRQELLRLEAERDRAATELRLLRAQVEPHMLFNSLAHVQSLIDSNPELGKRMLGHLIGYLRSALIHARQPRAPLGEEIRLLEHYLAVYRLRTGDRLDYRIDVPDALRTAVLPPMLLQPLVENAIRHGIEPAMEGGEVRIAATGAHGRLSLVVSDSGAGFGAAGGGTGTGLANLRERLTALYGNQACLRLVERPGGGVEARLELPLEDA
ncbi:histidine kinase [Aquisalimonas sp. 2447]|uniref:sensor histidine kinase n=1 Tax=Aquisalimonas sp. 2447 TaxID=2740807 RepID=UPI0014326643|nr:histidine kinase [Aquisalimonas sp. 2447]QIT54782.1 histidine kinase [Aquisalimonas sp. 2447]